MITTLMHKLMNGSSLNLKESTQLFEAIFKGEVSEIELTAILIAMKMRGETADEIAGAALSMRKVVRSFPAKEALRFDTCGTGGDNSHSFNISSAVAVILNAMGYPIVKHGNRSVSSKSGSADFYEALGIPVHLVNEEAKAYYQNNKFIFLFAPNYHPAMKYAVPVRRKLATRTIFNCLGPLTNPSLPQKQMIGVFHPDILPKYAEAATKIGYEKLTIYSAESGMDEISPYEPTIIYDIEGTKISKRVLDPAEYLDKSDGEHLPKDYDAEQNVALFLKTIQSTAPTPLSRILAINCALGLQTLEDIDFARGYQQALDCVHSGCVEKKLAELRG